LTFSAHGIRVTSDNDAAMKSMEKLQLQILKDVLSLVSTA